MEVGEDVVLPTNMKDNAKSKSVNRFTILNSVMEEIDFGLLNHMEQVDEDNVVEVRKARVVDSGLSDHMEQLEEDIIVGVRKAITAASGVADQMKTLKLRKKGFDKGKKGKTGSFTLEGKPANPFL